MKSLSSILLFFFSFPTLLLYSQKEMIRTPSNVIENDGKYGVISSNNDTIIPINYDTIIGPQFGLYIISKDSLWGGHNNLNQTIIPLKYKFANFMPHGIYTYIDSTYQLYDTTGHRLTSKNYSAFWIFNDSTYYFISINDKMGLLDYNGKEIIPIEYQNIWYQGGGCWIVQKEDKFGIYNSKGKLIKQPNYAFIGRQKCGWSTAIKIEQGHISRIQINKTGEVQPKPVATPQNKIGKNLYAIPFSISFKDTLKYVVFHKNGTIIFRKKCEILYPFSNHRAVLHQKGTRFIEIIDRNGNTIVSIAKGYVPRAVIYSDGLLPVRNRKGGVGYIDTAGNIAIPFQYIAAEKFQNGYAPVIKYEDGERKYYYINKKNQPFLKEKYPYITPFHDGYAKVLKKKWWKIFSKDKYKFGVIDTLGKTIIPFRFDGLDAPYSNNLIAAKKDSLWGFINHKGKFIIPPQFGYIRRSFHDSVAIVYLKKFKIPDDHTKNNLFMINQKGDTISETYSDIVPIRNSSLYRVEHAYHTSKGIRNLKGIIDSKGNEILAPKYDEITILPNNNGFCVIDTTRSHYIHFNKDGKILKKYFDIPKMDKTVLYISE